MLPNLNLLFACRAQRNMRPVLYDQTKLIYIIGFAEFYLVLECKCFLDEIMCEDWMQLPVSTVTEDQVQQVSDSISIYILFIFS